MQIEKVYEPQRFEPHWAQWWIDSGIFRASPSSPGRVFSLVIPPPNVTGSLHMGHMLEHTEIDVTVRWHRMRGDNTLWLPGTDHAGIATQMVVERQLAEEGINRRDLGREEFEERVWEWKAESGGTIKRQMIRLGASCDWSPRALHPRPRPLPRRPRSLRPPLRKRPDLSRRVHGQLVPALPDRASPISKSPTTKSHGHLWHIRYPVNGMPDRYLAVATTRPETMLGDTAVAINAKDARYLDLHGKTVQLPLMDREIPIILDDLADPEFGTGVVKVTPAHDPNDFEAGKRHNLPVIQVIDEDAKMTAAAGPYAGLDRFEARKRVVADLEELGLLEKIEDYTLSLGKCERCKTVVEPLVSTQWFVKTKPLAEKAIAAVDERQHRIRPRELDQDLQRMDAQHPRLVHLAPALVGPSHSGLALRRVQRNHRRARSSHRLPALRLAPTSMQDTDVLDTWFSSGLWPFSTLGWPDQTDDLQHFYPTSLLITGFDILFFWVARMVDAGHRIHGRRAVPPGLHPRPGARRRQAEDVEDQGQRDRSAGGHREVRHRRRPHGAAAAAPRPAPISSSPKSAWKARRAFANKIWNAARFLFMNMERPASSLDRRAARTPEHADRRPLDLLPPQRRRRAGQPRHRTVPLSRSRRRSSGTSSGTNSATGTSS